MRSYEKPINIIGEKVGIHPNLIRAFMMTESAFNKDAKSPAGAAGLMQIMPANYDKSKGAKYPHLSLIHI